VCAVLCAVAVLAACALGATAASANVTGPYCGASNTPRTILAGDRCIHTPGHNIYTVEGHGTVSTYQICVGAKTSSSGSGGSNAMPFTCSAVGIYGNYSDCPSGSGCQGYAALVNNYSTDFRGWGYLYAYS
jgi:hypothetical protein